jgi:hypothetical protein
MTVPSKKISTWRERIGQTADFPLHVPTDVERAMVAEIAELRAAAFVNVPAAPEFRALSNLSGPAVRGEAVAEELKLLHRGGHSPSTSNNGIAKTWMDELDQSREYMRAHDEEASVAKPAGSKS